MATLKITKLLLITIALFSAAIAPAARAATETYLFHDTLDPVEGAGNRLIPVSNATGTILTSGPSFLPGAFITETISPSACAAMPSVRAWSFPNTGGLRYDNAAPTLATGSYTISMLMRFSPMDGGYARLIDFSNSTQDTGIYKLSNGVSFFPVGFFAAGSFVSDQDVFVAITRDAATQVVSLFINGAPSGTYTDTGNIYAPAATVVYLLMDNTTGSAPIGETDPGMIAYLQISDTALTAAQVTASLAAICDVVSCGDGVVSGSETCDDANTNSGDGCSSTCAVETCWQCTGLPSVCTPVTNTPECAPTTTTATTTSTTITTTSSTTTTQPPPCAVTPLVGCRTPTKSGKAALLLKRDASDSSKNKVTWKWGSGAATTFDEFGDPVGTTQFLLCLYDGSGGSQPRLLAAMPGGGTCAGKPCWQASKTGYKYKDKDLTPDGIAGMVLKAGTAGKAKIGISGKGANLQMPPLPLAAPLVVQLHRSGGGPCWGATFTIPTRDDAAQLKAKSD